MSSVTVIIVNWNSGNLLDKTLAALMAQTLRDFHVMVVDNQSSDDSIACTSRWPEIEVLRQSSNLGFAAANNVAIRHCTTEWVALLNPDAIPAPDWLAQLLAAAAANTDFQFFGSRQLMAEKPGILDGTGDVFHVSGLFWRSKHGAPDADYPHLDSEIFAPCAAAAMYRRADLIKAEGFDESFFCYAEDVDLGFRLRLMGLRALYVSSAVVHHVGSAITGRLSDFTIYHSHRNMVWVFAKNMPLPALLLYSPLHLLINIYYVLRFGLRGQWRTIVRAKRDALLALPRIWRERGKRQADAAGKRNALAAMSKGWPRRKS